MKNIPFFALKEDLLAALEIAESNGPLNYALMGNFLIRDIPSGVSVFDAGAEIPNLGNATAASSMTSDSFLVYARESPLNLRRFQGFDGERVCLDQLVNPDSIEFKPGGIWNDDVVISGRISTASETETAIDLMKRFGAAVRKSFTKVRAFYVGPSALRLWESGKRLTDSAQSPTIYDLAPTSKAN